MATKFRLKRSTVGGVTPSTLDIDTAELAINLADRKVFTSNGSVVFEVGSNLVNLSVTANLTVRSIIANGGLGTSGQVLTTNGANVYWSTVSGGGGGVTSVATGNGLTGGPITNTGTISVLANNGITANTTGLFVTQGTGTAVNTTGVHVNSAYIGTIAANSATGSLTNTFTVGTASYFVANGNLGINTATPIYKLTVSGQTLSTNYYETVGSISNGALDLSTGNVFLNQPSANISYSFTNPPANNIAYGFTLRVEPSATVTFTWPIQVKWPAGIAPIAPANTEIAVYVFYTQNAGNTYFGFVAGEGMS